MAAARVHSARELICMMVAPLYLPSISPPLPPACRYPLMVCPVCRRNHGLGDPESPPPPGFAPESSREENTEEEEAAESTEVWCGAWRPPP